MKRLKKFLAVTLVLVMALGMTVAASAAGEESGFDALPAGTYTYVNAQPEAGESAGQVRFDYWSDTITWAFGSETGTEKLAGDELKFFQGLYLSDRPVTDWLGGATKNTEGYAGEVAGNVDITFTEDGKISYIYVKAGPTRAVAILSADITAPTLTVAGTTRGRPNLLQSCITLMGSTNALYLTKQGDVILDGLAIGNDGAGSGLKADKIGGDTFVVGTVYVDGTVNWNNKMGVILPLDSEAGVLETNGYDIIMTGGSNIGRVGRDLTISTGADKGGDIIIGATVSTDSTRGGLNPTADTSADGVTLNTRGQLIAGKGDVVIGTNTEKAVVIDLIGGITANNVTIRPTHYGAKGNVTGAIGNIDAAGDITIDVGTVNAGSSQGTTNAIHGFTVWEGAGLDDGNVIGMLTSAGGNISLTTGAVNGGLAGFSVPNGTVTLDVDVTTFGTFTLTVDGKAVSLKGCLIASNHYFTLDDLTQAIPALAGKTGGVTTVIVDGGSYVKLRDVCAVADINVDWSADKSVTIDTSRGY